tara:strand:- start:888 stop:1007 length:120 start_codon:yes stop_codon:yes gene_type:complete
MKIAHHPSFAIEVSIMLPSAGFGIKDLEGIILELVGLNF